MEEARLMTARELSRYLQVSDITIYKLVNEGKLPAMKIGNQWRFKKEDIDKALQPRTAAENRPIA